MKLLKVKLNLEKVTIPAIYYIRRAGLFHGIDISTINVYETGAY